MKTRIQRAIGALTIAAMLASASRASAMPVFDATALAQAIKQVEAWRQQFAQMKAQLKQMEDQHAALTGSRGLGNILNNPQLRATVPADVVQVLDDVRAHGAGALTSQAAGIRNASMIYDCQDRTGVDRTTCQAFLNNSAQVGALQQNAMVHLNQRMNQIEGLRGQINATTDPKSIAELTARLVAESAQVTNDANRLVVLNAMADSADRANQQALKERELLRLSRRGDGSDTFVYQPYVAR
ncbi:P-type DNA transfer protein VirB5 [Massilia sp. R2A-15]|uniref:P-type DNA transfer protein VirB5 n=1 Tax=Massilia sp. R2A-15 TaxID=3064278 RepID=UPI002732F55E|nr:P-type DNA transfer protein VirB5 [Massilia sp. R2A-15]WLI91080.1 P-type DNA transfer protein VirB5 [Massilia sp. R2A-15]